MSSDGNGDTASPSSSDYTEAHSDRKGDLATGPRGLCFFLYNTLLTFAVDMCTDHGAEDLGLALLKLLLTRLFQNSHSGHTVPLSIKLSGVI